MANDRRRLRARSAGLLLGMLIMLAVGAGRVAAPDAAGATASAAAAGDAAAATLDHRTEPVFIALNAARRDAGLPHLELDAALVASAAHDACAVARGDLPLSGDRTRMLAAGGDSENLGLVIDNDPAAGARTMNGWWASSHRHRRTRMEPELRRYGIGACAGADRTYYVERFAR